MENYLPMINIRYLDELEERARQVGPIDIESMAPSVKKLSRLLYATLASITGDKARASLRQRRLALAKAKGRSPALLWCLVPRLDEASGALAKLFHLPEACWPEPSPMGRILVAPRLVVCQPCPSKTSVLLAPTPPFLLHLSLLLLHLHGATCSIAGVFLDRMSGPFLLHQVSE